MKTIEQRIGLPSELIGKLELAETKTDIYIMYRWVVIIKTEKDIKGRFSHMPQDAIDAIYENIKQLDFENKVRWLFVHLKHPVRAYKRYKRGYKLFD